MLPSAFLERMKRLLGDEYEAFLASYDRPRNTGLRLNPRKHAGALPFCADRIPWEPNGHYLLPDTRPGLHPYHDAGVYYLQETEAPVDFRARADVIKLVMGEVENESHAYADDIIVTNPDDRTVSAHVPNYPESTLPATGGQGANWMLGASLTLLTASGLYLIYQALRKRREEEEAQN